MQIDPKLGIYKFHYEPFWYSLWFKVLVTCLASLFLSLIAFFVYKLIRMKFFLKKPIKADVWALGELSKFNLDTLENREDFKKFYFSLTSIIKNYLNRRFGWDLEHKTDEEIRLFIEKTPIKENLQSNLKQLFGGAQIIKFANEDALAEQARGDLEIAKSFIEATKQIDK